MTIRFFFTILLAVLATIFTNFKQATGFPNNGGETGSVRLGLGQSNIVVERDDIVYKYYELSNAFYYGDKCSWEAENFRQNNLKLYLDSSGSEMVLQQGAVEVVNMGYKLCSEVKLLVCDKKRQKCVCGSASHEALNGGNKTMYTIEENGKCRWNTGASCFPQDFVAKVVSVNSDRGLAQQLIELEINQTDFNCRAGTTCKMEDGKECSFGKMIEHFVKSSTPFTDYRSIAEEMYSGRICSCKIDHAEITLRESSIYHAVTTFIEWLNQF